MRLQPNQPPLPPPPAPPAVETTDDDKPAEQWFIKAKPAAAAAPTASSIAQRRLQRKPMGLQLDTSSGAMTIGGSDGPPPPPTAGGTWTMNAPQMTPATPMMSRMAITLPITPMAQMAPPMTPKPPMGSRGPGMASLMASGPGTPSEGADGLGSFAHGSGLSRKHEVREAPVSVVEGLDFISAGDLSRLLASGSSGLVVDMRSAAEYAAGRVAAAVNVAAPTTLVRRKTFSVERLLLMAGASAETAAAWKQSAWVALYGSGAPEDLSGEDAPLVLLARKLENEAPRGCRICVLRGGYDEFVREEKQLCNVEQCYKEVAQAPVAPQVVPADHPMLRSMREALGGPTLYAGDVIAMRLPPSHASVDKLPGYLRRVSGAPGAQHLHRLFASIDGSESHRMSSMIGSNGMVTARNAFTIAAGLELGAKNRYTNILPFDSNRVRLSGASDYINASFVSYFSGPLYIATQGPLPATTADFWQMVWDHRVRVIVMLTREFDNGRAKCHRYWPQALGTTVVHGALRVEYQAEARHPDDTAIVARRLRLSRIDLPDDTIIVTQLQYETWPDHGAPDAPLGVLRLRELACIAQGDDELAKNVPMVVHCSAGCGRTGAFCAIDTIMTMDPKEFVATPPVASAPLGMQMLPPGANYDPHGMYTGLVPQALRSKSSNASLAVEAEAAAETGSGSGSFNPRASRSLSRWNELPLDEFREDVVFIVVSRFRELRVSMVQTIQQFVFCHEALAWAALGAGPRPLSRVIDRRLVAEWNRANYPLLSEADCKDLTYQMRGRQEMLSAMLSADASSAGSGGGSSESNNSALVSGSGSGRASIDVSSGTMSAGSRPAGIVAPPLVKRSNSVGLARRGIFGAMFAPADVSDGGGTVSAGTKPTQQWNLAAPPVMKPAFSSDARLGIRNTPAVIAEEEEVLLAAADPVSAPTAERTTKPMFEAIAEQAVEPAVEPAAGPAAEPVMKPPQPKEVATAVESSTSSLSLSDSAVTKSPATALSSLDAVKVQQQQQYQQYQQQLQTHQFHQLQEVQNQQQQQTQQQSQKQRLAQRRPPGLSISISGAAAAPLISLATNSMPPPLLTNKLERPSPSGTNSGPVPVATDYFGCVREDSLSKAKNTPGNYSTDVMMDFDYCYSSGLGTAGGILDMFVGPPTSNAADWRRSVLGHLDASVEFSTAHGNVSASNTAPGSPSTGAFVGNSALASPRVK